MIGFIDLLNAQYVHLFQIGKRAFNGGLRKERELLLPFFNGVVDPTPPVSFNARSRFGQPVLQLLQHHSLVQSEAHSQFRDNH
ncbi:hypothetical protein [Xenorhabdus szentirmaii]|uniref:hypothetical protein n=1 Tax=Xenorhabdus szentirmaii TaxID=290112 RepID=UPI002B41632F|nr:hypothetical protein [Xenorhabdus sp. 42]